MNFNVDGIDNLNDYYSVELKQHRLSKLINDKFLFHHLNLSEINTLKEEYDFIFHLAAQAGVRASLKNKEAYIISNIQGFDHVCKFAKAIECKNIIYASSSSVYSDRNIKDFNEIDSDLKPKSFYGETKLANEEYAKEFSKQSNISMIGLRLFSVYGPMGRPDMAYYLFTDLISKNKEVSLINSGNMYRDMTYIDDVIAGIIQSMRFMEKNNTTVNKVFNLGSNNPIKTSYLLEAIESELNLKAIIKEHKSSHESEYTNADLKRAREILGYNPRTHIDVGIKKFIEWYKNYENV